MAGKKKAGTGSEEGGEGGNVGRATYLEFHDELTAALRLKASADSAVASVYKRAENAGIDRKQMKRAYAENLKATDEREVDDRRYRQYMGYLGKPIGAQPAPVEPEPNGEAADPGEAEAVAKHEVNKAFEEGVYAGKAGANMAASNPFQPGSEEYASFTTGWGEGQKEAVAALGGATRRRRVEPEPEAPAA